MSHFTYLAALLIGIIGMSLFDWRYKLAFWKDRRRTALTVGSAMILFIIWDICGITLGIFFPGKNDLTLPIRLLPGFPLEELFFLLLLCYTTLVTHQGALRRWPHI